MLHTKSQDHTTSRSGEEDFFKFLPYMGMAVNLIMWTIHLNFRSPFPRRLQIKYSFDWPIGFRGEDA